MRTANAVCYCCGYHLTQALDALAEWTEQHLGDCPGPVVMLAERRADEALNPPKQPARHRAAAITARAAFAELVAFKVELPGRGRYMSDMLDSEDREAPFFTEAYLYNLLGKDNARGLLALMRALGESLGFSMLQRYGLP